MNKFVLLFGLLVPSLAFAQSSIGWYKIAGGGGTSAGGAYQISDTIGQPDAGGAMAGGRYSLTGGFWSIISVVQTPGGPYLTISRVGNSVTISWPTPSIPTTLLQNTNLALPDAWIPTTYPISTNSGTNSITFTLPSTGNFTCVVHTP